MGVEVERLHLVALLRPIPEPVSVQPDVALALPARRSIAGVGETASLAALRPADVDVLAARECDDGDEPFVRPPGDRHRLVAMKDLDPSAPRPIEVGDAVGS